MKFDEITQNRRVAFYGGSFDPLHNGHLTIARKLIEFFALDEFVFIPAFHAPHKKDKQTTSAFHRYAMFALTTANESKLKISTVELDAPEKPFTVETQAKLIDKLPDAQIYFVIGADSWIEITTWREWEKVLMQTNIIVVTRPDYRIEFSHVTEEVRARIVDLRGQNAGFRIQDSGFRVQDLGIRVQNSGFRIQNSSQEPETRNLKPESCIYLTDAVNLHISATEIRRKIRGGENDWRELVPLEVAKYIEKYELYI